MEIERISSQPNRPTGPAEVGEQAAVRRADHLKRGAGAYSAGPSGAPTDSLEISDRARELSRAQRAVEAAPDVRADKVADIKRRIEDGTYHVSAEALARRMLGED